MTESEIGKAIVELVKRNSVVDRNELTRAESMASMYGEAVSKTRAAEIISCSKRNIANLVEAGKIRTCCDGTKIDVRSIADYITGGRRKRQYEDWMVK